MMVPSLMLDDPKTAGHSASKTMKGRAPTCETPAVPAKGAVVNPRDGLTGLRQLMELAPMPMWVSHPNGSCGWFNSAWLDLTGREQEQEQGDRWPSSLHHDDRPRVEQTYREALTRQEVFEVTYRLRRHDGAYRWIRDRGTPRYDAEGAFVGYIGTCIDVTDAEQTRQELERELANKARLKEKLLETQRLESLGVLAGGIAHDFNNLLMGIIGASSLLSEDYGSDANAAAQLSQIDNAAQQAAELCKQLLAYSGQRSVKLDELCLRSLVEDSANLWQHTCPKKVGIQLELSPETPSVKGDTAQLRQVLLNLVTNAWEAIGPHEGTVRVRTGLHVIREPMIDGASPDPLPPGRYSMLEVADDGSGMDAQKRSRIFDPFFTTKFTGRGLGLAAVLGIVRGHEGNIFVRSEPGAGTTFCMLVPALSKAVGRRPAGIEERSGITPRGLALVIDDEEMVRTLVSRMLRRVGYVVHEASDGAKGIQTASAIEAGQLELVVLDVMMPHIDGAEALRSIYAHHPDVLAVVMSGYSETETAAKFEGLPVAAFFEKPFTFNKLRKRLGGLLANDDTKR